MDAREVNKDALLGKLDGGEALMSETARDTENEEVEKVVLREYNLRQLEARDMGTMCKIITAIGIRQFRSIFSSDTAKELVSMIRSSKGDDENGENDAASSAVSEFIGISTAIDAVGIIMENYPKAENEIMAFLASVSGMEAKEIKKLSFADYGQMLIEIVMKEDFKDFFKRVRVLLHI